MQQYRQNEQLCFDDILLVPQASEVVSRKDIHLGMQIGYGKYEIDLPFPVIASPMDTVCESDMAIEIAKFGGFGIIHRYMDIEKQKAEIAKVAKEGFLVGAAVSIKDAEGNQDSITDLVNAGAALILLDVANGHNVYAVDAVRKIKQKFKIHVMAGNVSTWDGFLALSLAGADSIRVGIGGGSCCTTRIVTGHGMPTLASIMDVKEMLDRMDVPTSIIADGGIRNTGDMIKSFAAGADAIMIGSMLAGHEESPGEKEYTETGTVKVFRGMASEDAQINWRGEASNAEGISTKIDYKGQAITTLEKIKDGLSSGCSYSGVTNINDLPYNSQYIKVSSNSVKENQPHGQRNI